MVIRDKQHYLNRVDLLKSKGEMVNEALIKKCLRKIRKMDKKADA
jgi:hypothetical protein